ncbi:MAG: hypothetical protein QOK38_3129, partial [Acidobacteriaceae bacterium]|nr:hypothetical protein [Acidobacteriaceae bacterium]
MRRNASPPCVIKGSLCCIDAKQRNTTTLLTRVHIPAVSSTAKPRKIQKNAVIQRSSDGITANKFNRTPGSILVIADCNTQPW